MERDPNAWVTFNPQIMERQWQSKNSLAITYIQQCVSTHQSANQTAKSIQLSQQFRSSRHPEVYRTDTIVAILSNTWTICNPPQILEPHLQSKDSLAITYNDASVLENFHIAEAFKIIYDDRTDILSGLTIDDMRHFRQFVIKVGHPYR